MASPDPEGMSLLAKVMTVATAVIAPLWGGHKYLESRFDKKADKETVQRGLEELNAELTIQRGHIGKVFDQMRDSEYKNEGRHRELMMHLLEKK